MEGKRVSDGLRGGKFFIGGLSPLLNKFKPPQWGNDRLSRAVGFRILFPPHSATEMRVSWQCRRGCATED
jgi:hypothetical protein